MQEPEKKRWLEVCAEAANSEDPGRLMELAWEINRLLAQEELRLKGLTPIKRIA
jgi:hypothetical protein